MATLKNSYMLPADAPEGERLDFQHRILVRTFGMNQAPLITEKIRRVLDLGCGTGNWAIDFAKQNPHTEVLGLDINSYPAWEEAPRNCKFEAADIEGDIWAMLGEFDFIHGRFIVPGVRNWPLLIQRSYEHLSHGGWLELQDLKQPVESADDPADSKFCQFGEWMHGAMLKIGLDPEAIDKFADIFSTAGFQHVESKPFKLYAGPWADNELGEMGQANFIMGLKGFTYFLFVRVLGWSEETFYERLEETRKELETGQQRTFLRMGVCFGQK